MVAKVLSADAPSLCVIARALRAFCECMNGLDKGICERMGNVSAVTNLLFQGSQEIVGRCIPSIFGGLERAMEENLLRRQPFFEACDFLPQPSDEVQPFFQEAVDFCTGTNAESLKDTLWSMAQALKNASTEDAAAFNVETAMNKYKEHKLQAMCCICTVALQATKDTSIQELRSKFAILERSLGGIAGILIGCEAASWAPHAKNWVARNIVANIFGKSLALSGIPLQSALDAQPQGIESLIINKNHNKLRATLFNKDTHNAATHGLDEIVAIDKTLDAIMNHCNSCSLMSSLYLNKIKTFHAKVERMRVYSSIVHGLNMCFHRFPGKAKLERAALLRE